MKDRLYYYMILHLNWKRLSLRCLIFTIRTYFGKKDVTGYNCVLKLVAPDRKFPHKTFMISYLFETLYTLTPVYID